MGKIKKSRPRPSASGQHSLKKDHVPLSDQILDDKSVRFKEGGQKFRLNRRDDDDQFADEKLSNKILIQARKQQEELEDESSMQTEHGALSSIKGSKKMKFSAKTKSPSSTRSTEKLKDDDDDSDSDGGDCTANTEECYTEDIVINEEDERALEQFMPANAPARQRLADIIAEKLTEKKTEISAAFSDDASVHTSRLDERLVNIYRMVRDILQRYRSGRLPKPFKVIPKLENWEEVLYITEPDTWSAAAMYQATRIFVSNLKTNMAQRFLNLVLLPRVRDDIAEYKKLNFHLYQAMKKGLFKPNAFFKGFLLPLCESGTCTLREATIIASVLAKDSIPMLSSAAAILQIAEMSFNGANHIFLRTLLDKKYALPYRVIDAVVFHFIGFRTDKRELPVLWHQCLLTFVQRYKQDISSEQKEALMELLRIHVHSTITVEIRCELVSSQCREEIGAAATPMDVPSKTEITRNEEEDEDDDDENDDDESEMD